MRTYVALAALFLSTGFFCGTAVAASDEEKAKVCAEAEVRYKELYGKAPSEEPVTIVTMYKYQFCPENVTVKPGTTVRWVNIDKRTSHSYWFRDAGKEESERMFPEDTAEMTFDMPPGEYSYLCGPHWDTHGMIGKVIVAE
ncbi:MAG: plastocyanin/azurin family copper-binding protein [Hyphomicrobiales bacterium]